MNKKKEPAMSEFKVGDWVKMKDDSSAWMGKVAAIEYKPCFDSKWNRYEIEILVFEDGTKLGSGWAIHVVKAADSAGILGKRLEQALKGEGQ